MEKLKICKKCGHKYDPVCDIVEDYELLMSVDYFTDMGSINELCPDCIFEISDMLSEVAQRWEEEIK